MLGFTTNQLVVLFLVLVLGWLLGLLSRSSKKWRRAYEAEVEARETDRRAHAGELADRDRQIAERDRRLAELERHAVAPSSATTAAAVTPATLDLRRDANRRDDLSLIRGVGANGQDHLNDAGVTSYHQIRTLTADQATALEGRIGAPAGTIDRDEWREQAALLEDGKRDEHRQRFAG